MNYKINSIIVLIGIIAQMLLGLSASAQSLSPKVIASTGGYQSNSSGSLSYTIGETNTQTLTSATHSLTQGFQQPFDLQINIKAFLQGFYVGAGQMKDVLFNQGVYSSPTLITDSITVALHQSTSPFAMVFQTKTQINQNGTINIKGLGSIGQSYYIALKHRNSIETWSANAVTLQSNTGFDFSTAASQAFGSNQIQVQSGIFAIYSGDISQDGSVETNDYALWEQDANNFETGHINSDLSGDGSAESNDYAIWEGNANDFVSSVKP